MTGGAAPDSSRDPAIAIEHLDVLFGEDAGLADISLAVSRGERVAIVGPSGVGKTTLLRAVAGLAPVAGGCVRVGARDVTALAPERRDAVYLHQTPVLFAHLSVAENVAFPLRVRGRRGGEVRQRVLEALRAVRLDAFGERPVQTLSGGQRHRVALARAIAARPLALLLDEPLSALDPSLREEVRAAIVAAQEESDPGMEPGVLLVTHDLDDASLLGDRIAVLLDGALVQVAPPTEIFTQPATLAVARFLGIFQELPGQVRTDGDVACALGVVSRCSARASGGMAVLVRPESVHLVEPASGLPAARVVAVRHRVRGAGVVLHVGGDTDGALIEAAVAPGAAVPFIGAEVGVVLDRSGVLVFPS